MQIQITEHHQKYATSIITIIILIYHSNTMNLFYHKKIV